MNNMATILKAFENDEQYEVELISTYRITHNRLLVYGVLTTTATVAKFAPVGFSLLHIE